MPGDYPYFASTVIGFAVVLVVLAFASGKRRIMLIGGLTLLPFSICALFHEHAYWSTRRLGGFSWGFEDVLFTFSVGCLVAFVGALLFHFRMDRPLSWRLFFQKYLFICFSGTALALLFTIAGMDVMLATIVTQLIVIVMLTATGRYSFRISGATALVYTVYYTGMLQIFFIFFPTFAGNWNGMYLWPVKVYALPLEEIVWVFTFAWSWILILLYCLNFEKKTKGDVCEEASSGPVR